MINVDTKLFSFCDECHEFDPTMEFAKRYIDNCLCAAHVYVTCKNYSKCERIYTMLKKEGITSEL